MVTKRRVIIALLELAVVAALLVYALAPRSLERATGGVYDRSAVTAVEVEMTAANTEAESEAHRLSLTPGTEACDGLLDILERRYTPYYLDTNWEENIRSYAVVITITTNSGECTVSFTENDPIRMTSTGLDRPKTYRIWNGTFQGETLAYLLELEENN